MKGPNRPDPDSRPIPAGTPAEWLTPVVNEEERRLCKGCSLHVGRVLAQAAAAEEAKRAWEARLAEMKVQQAASAAAAASAPAAAAAAADPLDSGGAFTQPVETEATADTSRFTGANFQSARANARRLEMATYRRFCNAICSPIHVAEQLTGLNLGCPRCGSPLRFETPARPRSAVTNLLVQCDNPLCAAEGRKRRSLKPGRPAVKPLSVTVGLLPGQEARCMWQNYYTTAWATDGTTPNQFTNMAVSMGLPPPSKATLFAAQDKAEGHVVDILEETCKEGRATAVEAAATANVPMVICMDARWDSRR